MKKYLVGLSLLIGSNPVSSATKQKAAPAFTYDYVCQKGKKKITYRIEYKSGESLPPCRIYEIIKGKRKIIAESLKKISVCENALDDAIDNAQNNLGMICRDLTDDC
jgi:hypothetical protein